MTEDTAAVAVPGPRKAPWVRVPERVGSALSLVAGVAIIALMLITVIDVVLRKFFSSGFPGAIEINEIALVVIVYLAIMTAELTNVHVRTPILVERVKPTKANILHIIGLTPAVLFVAWATVLTAQEAVRSINSGEFRFGVVDVQLWPAKVAVALGLAGLTIALAIKLATAIRNAVRGQAAEISSHESLI